MDIAKADFIEGMAKGLAVLESFDTERQRLIHQQVDVVALLGGT